MKKILLTAIVAGFMANAFAQYDWDDVAIPADAGEEYEWVLQENASDDFNYTFEAKNAESNFGNNKWLNFYHNSWDGPGTTYWKYNHVSVDGSDLVINASRWTKDIMTQPAPVNGNVKMQNNNGAGNGVMTGCITSNNPVQYPVFIEGRISVNNLVLASDIWLLSPDDTQEIDIIECYGGKGSTADGNDNSYFSKSIHLSHHSFERPNPFYDYQPRDANSWWNKSGVNAWGDYCWNGGQRRYVRVGVNWISPFHLEYFVDGEKVRVLYHNAFATNKSGTWYYSYPVIEASNPNAKPEFGNIVIDGYQQVVFTGSSSEFDFDKLKAASNVSQGSVIDPGNFQEGKGMHKAMDIIINVESQDWHVAAGRVPTDADLLNPAKNLCKVDWVRVYKPELKTNVQTTTENAISIYPNPAKDVVYVKGIKTQQNIKVEVFNLAGKKVKSEVLYEGSISLRGLSRGVYLIRVGDDYATTVVKK